MLWWVQQQQVQGPVLRAHPAAPGPPLRAPPGVRPLCPDISMSLHFRRYFPWIWSFPLMEFNLLDGEPTWHAALKRHFVEVNNAVARYDSNARTERFFELLKFRCLVEISQPKKYTVWRSRGAGQGFA